MARLGGRWGLLDPVELAEADQWLAVLTLLTSLQL